MPAETPEATPGTDQTVLLERPESVKLKDFQVVARLGEGGMGIVYRAHQLSLDRDVALKVLAPHVARNRSFVDRFIREARMSVKLDHPNIVRGLAVGEEDGLYYFAMELVDGESLDHRLQRGERLSVGDAVRIMTDVARALDHAHSRSILHRDIKPANILVTREGQVKLADLGLARVMDDTRDLTQVGEGAGTPTYMPLEQALSAGNATARSDIYALGATTYHLVTGVRPFAGATAYEVMRAKETGTHAPASTCNPEVPDELDRIIERAMAPDPAARYRDAAELVEALEATGLASETLSLIGTAATASASARTTTRPTLHARRSTAHERGVPLAGAVVVALALLVVAAVAVWQFSPRVRGSPRGRASIPATTGGAARAEPVDIVIARSVEQLTRSEVTQARTSLAQGLREHPGERRLERLLAELTAGVAILFQYQTPEDLSPIIPLAAADGVTLTRRDNYRFALIPARECHVYVYQRDTRPSVTRIFPNARYSPLANPLSASVFYWLPSNPEIRGPAWLYLDASLGEERVFFVAVTKPLRDADGFGRRLLESPERLQQELSQNVSAFLVSGGAAGAPCFASEGSALQSFTFNHK